MNRRRLLLTVIGAVFAIGIAGAQAFTIYEVSQLQKAVASAQTAEDYPGETVDQTYAEAKAAYEAAQNAADQSAIAANAALAAQQAADEARDAAREGAYR